jgi:16S rRNA (guanine527-N7)-methyltransferase
LTVDQLIHFCKKYLMVDLDQEQINKFKTYENELLEWNKKFNLTSITEPAEIEVKHFIDSLTCLLALNVSGPYKIIDIGTGAGFPGIPIKIVKPSVSLTLLESTQKKAEFCINLVKKLHLVDVTVLTGRAEEIAHLNIYRENFNVAIARAVATLPTLMEYLLPFLEMGGTAIAMKGKNIQDELHSGKSALKILGGKYDQVVKFNLPLTNEERNLVMIKKEGTTPEKYPRRSGIPAHKPLL